MAALDRCLFYTMINRHVAQIYAALDLRFFYIMIDGHVAHHCDQISTGVWYPQKWVDSLIVNWDKCAHGVSASSLQHSRHICNAIAIWIFIWYEKQQMRTAVQVEETHHARPKSAHGLAHVF